MTRSSSNFTVRGLIISTTIARPVSFMPSNSADGNVRPPSSASTIFAKKRLVRRKNIITLWRMKCAKQKLIIPFLLSCLLFVSGCSTNPATGQSQFTALMSPTQEVQVGAQEHSKIIQQFGTYADAKLQGYINEVGNRIVPHTERKDVKYKFYLLDSPIVNAFALPGGYVYLTRGLLALSNSESEMAAVLAHEVGHITARHSAERYSRGVVTSLGAMVLSTAIGSTGVSQALGIGSDLYIKSYSRGQESQADDLGIRYLSRSGYDPKAMARFLENLKAEAAFQAQLDGKKAAEGTNYFSTHPATDQRIVEAVEEARNHQVSGLINQEQYLRKLDGMTYGDSAKQGFARDGVFYHPELGFKFSYPSGYKVINQPSSVVAASQSGAVMVFDIVANKEQHNPMTFLKSVWMNGDPVNGAENMTVNGMQAATASFQGKVNGRDANIRLIAIQWSPTQMARFQIAMPPTLSGAQLDDLKRASYSFARLSASEKSKLRPYRLKVVTASSGDTVQSLAAKMPYKEYKEEHFRTLNGLSRADRVVAGQLYKLVVD
ncbi:MAG: M48 family metalloprotease [Alphaproteobacteria bacterium]|nr:M48 family metalloprotease [Alphaproteobacteria bacterium]